MFQRSNCVIGEWVMYGFAPSNSTTTGVIMTL